MSKRRATQNEQKKTFMVQSKVSASTMSRIDAIVEKYGFSARYELIQFLISAFLRYADPEHEDGITQRDEMLSEIGRIFAGYDNPDERINIVRTSDSEALTLTDALFLYSNGTSTVVKRMRYTDTSTICTCSVNSIFQLVMTALLPAESEYLKTVAQELDSSSLLVALDYLIEADKRCGRFQPDNYAANEYGIVPVRHQNRTQE